LLEAIISWVKESVNACLPAGRLEQPAQARSALRYDRAEAGRRAGGGRKRGVRTGKTKAKHGPHGLRSGCFDPPAMRGACESGRGAGGAAGGGRPIPPHPSPLPRDVAIAAMSRRRQGERGIQKARGVNSRATHAFAHTGLRFAATSESMAPGDYRRIEEHWRTHTGLR